MLNMCRTKRKYMTRMVHDDGNRRIILWFVFRVRATSTLTDSLMIRLWQTRSSLGGMNISDYRIRYENKVMSYLGLEETVCL